MTTHSEEEKATADKVERILLIAKAAFFNATDSLGCIEMFLEASRTQELNPLVAAANGQHTGNLVMRALLGHCLMSVMTAFDREQPGDLHLGVGMNLLNQIPREVLCELKDAHLAAIEAAKLQWAECRNFKPLDSLRTYRNKFVAHNSQYPADKDMPVIGQLFHLAEMTARTAELLARGTGAVGVSLESQVIPYRENSRAFWA
jgi:hypothetical protein